VLAVFRLASEPTVGQRGAFGFELLVTELNAALVADTLTLTGVERGWRQFAPALVLARSEGFFRTGRLSVVTFFGLASGAGQEN
jgi:hypothetical protein